VALISRLTVDGRSALRPKLRRCLPTRPSLHFAIIRWRLRPTGWGSAADLVPSPSLPVRALEAQSGGSQSRC
jgi:hypothetical protein